MNDIFDEAARILNKKGPNADIIARLACKLEQTELRNYRLMYENRHIRRSRRKLKTWFNRQFKYYKAHRDELLNEKNEKCN